MDPVDLVLENGTLFAAYRKGSGAWTRKNLSVFLPLDEERNQLLHSMLRFVSRSSPRSASGQIHAMVELGKSLRRLAIERLPCCEAEWQTLVLNLYRDIITNVDSRASLFSRAAIILPRIERLLSHLKTEDLIPTGVKLPGAGNLYAKIGKSSTSKQVIGQEQPVAVRNYDSKLLCSVSLSRTDANYLDEFCRELAARRAVLREALLAYWTSLKEHFNYGQALMASVDKSQLLKRLEEYERSISTLSKYDKNAIAFCTPDTEARLAEFLVIIQHRFGGLPSSKQSHKDKSIPSYIESSFKLPTPPNLKLPGEHIRRDGAHRMQIRWMLGRLWPCDIAVMAALLIMESPRFTPEAVTSAKLVDAKGHRFVEFTDLGQRFSVAKNRAKALKTSTLSSLSEDIVRFASECSPDIRSRLREAGSPVADLLFIPCANRVGHDVNPAHERCVAFISGSSKGNLQPWLGDMFPKLIEAGMTRGTISFSRIRNTEGVLEWFRTGSIDAMSGKLGNTKRTCIDHYLPPALLDAWNTRLIRRFQNLWICVAAAKDDWLLEVTDFSTLEELHAFINDMLVQHDQFSSPLAAQLHKRFGGNKYRTEMTETGSEKTWLAVAISKNSLAALYLYLEISLALALTDDVLDYEDKVTHITPRQFIDLAILLSQRLPQENNPIFLRLHNEAKNIATELVAKVHWQDILFRKGHDGRST